MNRKTGYLSPWIWATYVFLFIIAVPWYWPSGHDVVVLGLPLWVMTAVIVSFLISCFTAWLFLCRWPKDELEEEKSE